MRNVRVLTAIVTLISATAGTSAAETITTHNTDTARANVRVGYGGRGVDLDLSIDSPRLAHLVRFRAGVGHGHWVGINSAGNEPAVTRLAISALFFIPTRDVRPILEPYVGIGIGAFVPRGAAINTQTGRRLILGMEGSGESWTVGTEVEVDFTTGDDGPSVRDDLLPTFRIGLALRRRF